MEKIRIVVCDNNPQEQEYYIKLCRMLGEKCEVEVKFKSYTDSHLLEFDLEDSNFLQTIDILQLEVNIAGTDGIALARHARKLGYKGLIVFLTHLAENEYYERAFDVGASNYIRKGEAHLERLVQVFMTMMEEAKRMRRESIVLRCAGERRRIDLIRIKYFENFKYRMVVYYDDQSFEFLSSMLKLESELLGRGFMRIHRGYMVSLDQVKTHTYNSVTLFDGTTLPLGRTYSANFKSAIERWRA